VERYLADTREDRDFRVFPENWPALQLFLRVVTQWRYAADQPTGLDYTAVIAVMAVEEAPDRRDLLDRVQVMELAALQEFRKKAQRR